MSSTPATSSRLPRVPSITRQVPFRSITGDRLAMLIKMGAALHEGRIGRHQFGTRTVILVNTPEDVGEVFLTREEDYRKGPALSLYARPLLGNGLLSSEGDFHRRQRRLAAPAFAHKRVAAYTPFMAEATETAQARWQDGETIDLSQEMMRLTLTIVGKTLFDTDDVEGEADELSRALTIAMQFFIDILRSPVRPPFAWVPPWAKDVRWALGRLDETIYRLIAERRESGKDTGDLLSMLLFARNEDGAGMDDKQIRDETMTLFLAGHETTANLLAWTWYLLATHPDIYKRVREETDAQLAGRTPTFDDLEAMPYSLQVIKESMRLYPPAYAVVRQALRPTRIGHYHVPAKAVVVTSPYLLHRRPDAFPDPERFVPERFTPEAEQARARYAYLPFGAGPRICIGAAFALMEAQLILCTIVQRVTLRRVSNEPIVPEPLITLRPRGGVPLIVERRQGALPA